MNKSNFFKRATKIIAITIGIVLSILLLFILNIFFSNPVSKCIVWNKMEAYVAENYTDFDFHVRFPQYNWYDGYYSAETIAKDDENIKFEVFYWTYNGRCDDDYDKVLIYLLTPILQGEFPDDFYSFHVITTRGFSQASPPLRDYATIKFKVESLEPAELAEIMIKSLTVIEQKGYEFKKYDFCFKSNDEKYMSIHEIGPEYINESLTDIIAEMQEDFDYDGYYKSTGIWYNFKYNYID